MLAHKNLISQNRRLNWYFSWESICAGFGELFFVWFFEDTRKQSLILCAHPRIFFRRQ